MHRCFLPLVPGDCLVGSTNHHLLVCRRLEHATIRSGLSRQPLRSRTNARSTERLVSLAARDAAPAPRDPRTLRQVPANGAGPRAAAVTPSPGAVAGRRAVRPVRSPLPQGWETGGDQRLRFRRGQHRRQGGRVARSHLHGAGIQPLHPASRQAKVELCSVRLSLLHRGVRAGVGTLQHKHGRHG